VYTIDFETKKIVSGSPKSPKPVGVAIKHNRKKSIYMSWGHPTENNTTYSLALNALQDIWDSGEQILMQNAKFDLRVAMEWFNLPYPHGRVEDSMFWSYLNDPREETLSLKPMSDKYLDMPPDEQQGLHEWIVKNVLGATIATAGAYISEAPGELAGIYAVGDTERTYKLYRLWFNKWRHDKKMVEAYKREILLLPVVIDMEQKGIRLSPDLPKVHKLWSNRFNKGEKYLSQVTPEKPGTKAMFNSLREQGYIDEDKIVYTEKGNPRYGKSFLATYIEDKKLKTVLMTRSKLQKIVGTYLAPWLKSYEKYGRFYPYFNQTRNEEDFGTRSGRFSSNLQQIPKIPKDKDTPNLRLMIMPDEGEIMIKCLKKFELLLITLKEVSLKHSTKIPCWIFIPLFRILF
jgi:DNA polymerase I-like protein with 3'-5' exonuclease and polymerase domains